MSKILTKSSERSFTLRRTRQCQKSSEGESEELIDLVIRSLSQINDCLLTEIKQLEQRQQKQQGDFLRQMEEKDKLILSLSKINNKLMKDNARNKKKSEAQFQYFVKRIAEAECSTLNNKKKLEDNIEICHSLISRLLVPLQETCQQKFQIKFKDDAVKILLDKMVFKSPEIQNFQDKIMKQNRKQNECNNFMLVSPNIWCNPQGQWQSI